MRILPKQIIADIPILKVRDFFVYLDRHHRDTFILKEVCDYFNISESKAKNLLNELFDEELIEVGNGCYKLTLKGTALSIARCVPPLNRVKADKILKDFMQRVEEINSSDYYLYSVSKILLFGSYIQENAIDFGDIDIAFELEKKIKNYDEHKRLNNDLVKKARAEGRSFSSFVDEIFYSRTLVELKLKNRNRYISLHEMSDGVLEITETKQIYPVVME